MALRSTLTTLAEGLAEQILEAIRTTSLEELLGETGSSKSAAAASRPAASASRPAKARASNGRLPRRSMTEITEVVGRITELLRKSPGGLRAEQIRSNLGMQAKEMPRPIKELLDSGKVRITGQKRATTYILKTGASSNGAAKVKTASSKPSKSAKPAKKKSAKSSKPSKAKTTTTKKS